MAPNEFLLRMRIRAIQECTKNDSPRIVAAAALYVSQETDKKSGKPFLEWLNLALGSAATHWSADEIADGLLGFIQWGFNGDEPNSRNI